MVKVVRDHEYNDPNISATDFLTAMMHDRTVPLALRVDAANHLMRLPQPPPAVVTVRIQGGVPKEPVDPDLLAQHPMLRLVQ
jgi:hypothetical protein